MLSAGPSATAASTSNNLGVDLGSNTGQFDGGASGARLPLADIAEAFRVLQERDGDPVKVVVMP